MLSILEIIFIAAVGWVVYVKEKRQEVVQGDNTDEVETTEKRREYQRGGGVDPIWVNEMEVELINRSVPLPARDNFITDPAGYAAQLRLLIEKTTGLAQGYQAITPAKFSVAVPESAREAGHVLTDMMAFKRGKERALAPPPVEHMDS